MPVAFIGPGTQCTAQLRDISANGCLLLLRNDQVKIGTFGRLGIQVGQETMRAQAVVKRVIPSLGVGFEFGQMFPSDRILLDRLIASLSTGQPAHA